MARALKGERDPGRLMFRAAKGLQDELAKTKRQHEAELLSAIEFGYRQCEKGLNLQATLALWRGLK